MKANILIKGSIQGKGYRVLIKNIALSLGIKGLVRNLEYGSVEIFLETDEDTLSKFIDKINIRDRDEILGIKVDEIKIFKEGEEGYRGPWKEYRFFEIDYGDEDIQPFERELIESLEWAKLHFSRITTHVTNLQNSLQEFTSRTDQNFRIIMEKYGEISEKLTEILNILVKESKETREMINQNINLLKEAIEKLSK